MTATRNRFKGELTLSIAGDVAPPKREGADLTPFVHIVQGSWDKVQAGNPAPATLVNVPIGGETLFVTRCRQAADELGIGVSVTQHAPGQMVVLARTRKAAPTRKDGTPISRKAGSKGMPPVPAKGK